MKFSGFSNTKIHYSVPGFGQFPIEKYVRTSDITENYINECTTLYLQYSDLHLNSPYFYRIFKQSSKLDKLMNINLWIKYVFMIYEKSFVSQSLWLGNSEHPKEIYEVFDWSTRNSILNDILLVFPKKTSLWSITLEQSNSFYDSDECIYDFLNTNYVDLAQWKIRTQSCLKYSIPQSQPKITENEWGLQIMNCWLFSKGNILPNNNFIHKQKFNEFEDEHSKTREILFFEAYKKHKVLEEFSKFFFQPNIGDFGH